MTSLRIVPTEIPGKLRLIGELDISFVEEVQVPLEQKLLDGRQLALDASEWGRISEGGIWAEFGLQTPRH